MDIKEYIETKTVIPIQIDKDVEQLQLEDRLITWRKSYMQGNPEITDEEYDTELNRLKLMSTELYIKAYSLQDVVDKIQIKNLNKKYYITEKLEGVAINIVYKQGNIKYIQTETGLELNVEDIQGIQPQVNPQIKAVRGILTLKKELQDQLKEEISNIENLSKLVTYLIETGNTQYLDLFALDVDCKIRLYNQKNKKLEEIGYKPLAYKLVEGNNTTLVSRLNAGIENLSTESGLKTYITDGYIIQENNGNQAVHYINNINNINIKESYKNIYRVKVLDINIAEKTTELKYNIVVDREIGSSGKNIIESCTLKDIWIMGVKIGGEIYVRQGVGKNYICTEQGQIII